MSFDALPIYEADQVLTAASLNDMRDYLERETRLTRRVLIGIGVMCGFDVDVDTQANVRISRGVAVTSEGYVIAEEAVVCDRRRDYALPLPTGDDVTPAEVDEAQYPFLFPDGNNQIEAWELLSTDANVSDGDPDPEALTSAFLADKTVLLFLEITQESLRNCDINDCSDQGSEMRFALRRLLIRRSDADAIMAAEQTIAGFPTDPANHPHLDLPLLRVPDLGFARHDIGSFPALFARIFQIAIQLSAHLPQAMRDAWATWQHVLRDIYPEDRFPGVHGPLTDDTFGNVWANLIVEPFQAQYFYDYMLDVVMAYNEFVAMARTYSCECLPNPARFPRHVLLGDTVARPIGSGLTISTPAEFAAFDPLAASTGLGPQPRPPRRRTPWTPACRGKALQGVRWSFYRMILLGQAFDLRGGLSEEVRITPSRHDTWTLGDRCIGHYYSTNINSDLFRVWSPEKTATNRLSTVYHRQFCPRDVNHPLLYRGTDGETHYEISGHIGKGLDQVLTDLVAHKHVLGLDFAIHPLLIRLGIDKNAESLALDRQAAQRAMVSLRRLILCRMGDYEVILLALLGALFALLVQIVRGIARQSAVRFATGDTLALAIPEPEAPANNDNTGPDRPFVRGDTFSIARDDVARLLALARMDAIRRPETPTFNAIRMTPQSRAELNAITGDLLKRFRDRPIDAKLVINRLAKPQDELNLGAVFTSVIDDPGDDSLFEKVRRSVSQLDISAKVDREAATQRVFTAVAATEAGIDLMDAASISTLENFEPEDFDRRINLFADRLNAFAAAAPVDPSPDGDEAAATNLAIADYAVAIDAQRAAFGTNGLAGEFQRRFLKIFEDMTLDGHARHMPGLEHRAGVPRGGTFYPICISRPDLIRQLELIAPSLNQLGENFAATVNAPLASGLIAAAQALLAAAGPANEDTLSDLIVVGDACTFHECCDGDCSDLVVAERIPRNYFNLRGEPAIALDPIMPNGDPPRPTPDHGFGDSFTAILWDIGVAPTPSFTHSNTYAVPSRPVPDNTGDLGRIIGRVRADNTRGVEVQVRITDLSGRTQKIIVTDMQFETQVQPGIHRLIAIAEGMIGEAQSITVAADDDTKITLILRPEV